MSGVARAAPPHVFVVDIDQRVTRAMAAAWRDHPLTPVRGICRYLGSVTQDEVADIHAESLFVQLVTFGDARSGGAAEGAQHGAVDVQRLTALQAPPGVTVWTDYESFSETAPNAIGFLNARGQAHKSWGASPGLYVGAGQPLDGTQLGLLIQIHYWQALSILKAPPYTPGWVIEPTPGWCQRQLPHTRDLAGYQVDVNVTQYDWRGRLPNVWYAS